MTRSRRQEQETTIEPRRRPRQDRSRGMVERILSAAQQLLGAVGFKGLTTIAIAERAELSVGSLYQYFPNKEAVILELARRWFSAFRTVLDAQRDAAPVRSWSRFEQVFHDFVGVLAGLYRSHADLLPVLEAMQANAELRRIVGDHDAAIVKAQADWFTRINPALDRDTAARLGLVILETGHAGFAAAVRQPAPVRDLMVADLERMHLALLRPHLGLA
ncbi:TetR/AcrR family transcriptional regulator [Inquilinus limosus]|uniref:TetR/AcrR family transcriptional regulator n=1 Tax=Inquilinus limosus TaxID=171674 RepID=UPI0004047117|nr:TetR/AcrR family transcriptional regulator [Inquilinus limosus]